MHIIIKVKLVLGAFFNKHDSMNDTLCSVKYSHCHKCGKSLPSPGGLNGQRYRRCNSDKNGRQVSGQPRARDPVFAGQTQGYPKGEPKRV